MLIPVARKKMLMGPCSGDEVVEDGFQAGIGAVYGRDPEALPGRQLVQAPARVGADTAPRHPHRRVSLVDGSRAPIHGYEPVALRYFQVTSDGTLRYLTDEDLTKIDAIKEVGKRNRELELLELGELAFEELAAERDPGGEP